MLSVSLNKTFPYFLPDTATDSIKQLFYHEMLIMKKIPKYVHVVAYLGYNMKSGTFCLTVLTPFLPSGSNALVYIKFVVI